MFFSIQSQAREQPEVLLSWLVILQMPVDLKHLEDWPLNGVEKPNVAVKFLADAEAGEVLAVFRQVVPGALRHFTKLRLSGYMKVDQMMQRPSCGVFNVVQSSPCVEQPEKRHEIRKDAALGATHGAGVAVTVPVKEGVGFEQSVIVRLIESNLASS